MSQVVYPKALKLGSKIAVTAFSSGVPKACHPRLNIVLTHLQAQGFEVLEGQCLKHNIEHVSASAEQRAHELMTFLCDDRIGAIAPPWGGELAMEVLPLLDFERLKLAKPKWLFGFSDISTLGMVLMSKLGWSSAHCSNLMQLHPDESEPLTAQTLQHLVRAERGYSFTQVPSKYYQTNGESFAENPDTVMNVTEQTCWRTLPEQDEVKMSGRLIGGCFDTLQYLLGTPYFDLTTLKQRFTPEGIILYFENAELSPTAFKRALLSLKFKGVFEQINGLLIGRNAVIGHGEKEITSEQVLLDVISKLDIPVIYDVDIGHLPPNLTLFNGAYAHISAHNGMDHITQTLK
ncbi:Microcin C7 self-immunity protein MccF [Pseudoalteromonas holothuriae]|uniref:Microcin C7 self-immunity protein MccF n=1 Tax=Pseudoalteromonas holothuriae TaxID=2963714 RepID=A0ABM9GJJ5_9GAMM|nr:S66 peptidase family protein [Pseudoalteromonas sp. CIP111951]CAH9059341.1 Microcin C7 self-immunity protein MccF [Pseudoalteromonas sp. CIP111951]